MTDNEKMDFLAKLMGSGNTTIGQLIMDNHGTMNINNHGGEAKQQEEKPAKKEITTDVLTRAIENCQQYFWGHSAYAVLFCVCRDDYKMEPNKTAFEQRIELLPYKKTRAFSCPAGTLANAFSDNAFYNEKIDKWDKMNLMKRVIVLRDEFRKQLEL